ncbi:hypothetical protein [Streptomyces sp. ISID311]|uniref:hypothetical protein n=1 Tax=Streptomyces sp. ISID311 TaxID=2601673 RepID=UPI00164C5FB7|nr:hypothetical protein [Streptomyces sp. ISID311]
MDAPAKNLLAAWADVDTQIGRKAAAHYDRAAELLQDLRAAHARNGRTASA